MKRSWLVPVVLVLAAASGRADEPSSITPDELQKLAERALTAAVASSGKSAYSLEDTSVMSEGSPKTEEVVAAIRAAASKAGVRLVKHADNLEAPMLHARFSSLLCTTPKESTCDHGIYVELEGPTRALIHANVTNLHKTGPGAERLVGHHTAQGLDAFADGFVVRVFAKPSPLTVTVVGQARTNGAAQQSLVERITQRVLAGKTTVIAARSGSGDVTRPKNVTPLATQLGVLVALQNDVDVLQIDGNELASRTFVFHYRFPRTGPEASGPGASAIRRMEKLAIAAYDQFNNNGYRIKPQGAKGKVWILEAKVEQGAESLKDQLTQAARGPLVGHELLQWIFEAKDGDVTAEQAKAAGIEILIFPGFKTVKAGTKEVSLQVRRVSDDSVIADDKTTYEERK